MGKRHRHLGYVSPKIEQERVKKSISQGILFNLNITFGEFIVTI